MNLKKTKKGKPLLYNIFKKVEHPTIKKTWIKINLIKSK
jgi:hypothetical protein